ncbi:MAG: DUF2203 domain-containing protein [Oligoflexia bacterium]|nr:DUF2203 domain-containing protein [Oligoflexia bacterium]
MGTVFQFNQKRILTLQEARELLPIVRRITEEASRIVNGLIATIEALPDADSVKKQQLENEINKHVELWQAKVEKLGGEPKGLWLVDFDSGMGYFCWKFPEDNLDHFHAYTEGFKSRIKIDESFDEKYAEPSELLENFRKRLEPPISN